MAEEELLLMNPAGERRTPWARGRPSVRFVSNAIALFVVLILLGGELAFTLERSLDVVAWLVLATTFTAVGAAVVSRVPENSFGWVLLAIGVTSAITVSTASVDVPGSLAWLRSWVLFVPAALLPIALLLFPTGRPPSARWQAAFALAVVGVAMLAFFLAVASAIAPDPLGLFGGPPDPAVDGLLIAAGVGGLVCGLSLLLGVLSLFSRLREREGWEAALERRQVLCLFLGAIVLLLALPLEIAGMSGAWIVGSAALPVATGVAMLGLQLYDFDLFMNRSLVYIGLSAVLLAIFATIVLFGHLVAASVLPDGAPTLIAVGVVALSVDPLRRRLQHSVDRLLYGNRNDPYAVVTALGRGLGSSTEAPTMLADVAEAVARSLALPYAAIQVPSQKGSLDTAEWGRCHGQPIELPLAYRGEQIGSLLVTPRTVNGRLSEHDWRLLEDIAHPVALTVSAVELSARLQRAREQLVTAREEERRRLRQALHDVLGSILTGMVMQLDAASNMLLRDPTSVAPVMVSLRSAAQDAVIEVRRLVDELRPRALEELGLIGAIREWTDRFFCIDGEAGLALSLEVPAQLPSLSAAVEVAALRIVQEATANVARHSQANSCRVRLAANGALAVEIEDDGRGLRQDDRPGVGLDSMKERAAEVGGTCTITSPAGGGTHVHAILPLHSS
jgi:two-component system NarL family sensor kinase